MKEFFATDLEAPLLGAESSTPAPPAVVNGAKNTWDRPLLEYDGPNISAYNTQKLIRHEFLRLSGTVFDFRRRFPWFQLLIMLLFSVALAVYTAHVLKKGNGDAPETESWWVNLHTAQGMFNTLVIFLLGFATNNSYTRWWAMRMALGNMQRDVAAFTILANAHLSNPAADCARLDLGRYAQIIHALCYKMASRNTNYADLKAAGLLRENEFDLLSAAPQPVMVVVHWINTRLLTTVAEDLMFADVLIPETGLGNMQRYALDMGTQIRIILDYIETQLPFPYVHMLTLLVKVNLLLIACDQGERAGAAFVAKDQPWVILSILQLALTNFFFQGILHLISILENPFLSHPSHFPRRQYLAGLRRNLAHIEANARNVPFDTSALTARPGLRFRLGGSAVAAAAASTLAQGDPPLNPAT